MLLLADSRTKARGARRLILLILRRHNLPLAVYYLVLVGIQGKQVAMTFVKRAFSRSAKPAEFGSQPFHEASAGINLEPCLVVVRFEIHSGTRSIGLLR